MKGWVRAFLRASTVLPEAGRDIWTQRPGRDPGRTLHEDSDGGCAPHSVSLAGRLAPYFEPVEIGLGNNYVADAIARAFGRDRATVLERFDRLGDLGEAAAEIATESGSSPVPTKVPPVREIFDRLLEIARTTGAGSVRAKVEAFASLLGELDPLSCNYLCRVPLGRMRLGVGDPTVLDAFSFARVGDKSLRKGLERAYNETSDLD